MPTKVVVLDRALQYISHLVSTYDKYQAERDELRRKLQGWLDDPPSSEEEQQETTSSHRESRE
ncbi:hypothetical protein BX600DRAFT_467947 [Xylariales sp. PMI_506]|nr:hypothetical protein BX600DRAFT_467947 [Xylariales sp. PMI_506]